MKAIWDVNKTFNIKKERLLGNTYTHPIVSNKIVQQIPNIKIDNILDPSVGTGSFYYAILDSQIKYNKFDCYDISKDALSYIKKEDERTTIWHKDFLLERIDTKYSLIITNPPYIGYYKISSNKQDRIDYIEKVKDTIDFDILGISRDEIKGRSDIYIYFYLKALSLLKYDGILVFLCADKWLETNYGQVLKKVLKNLVLNA